MNDIAVIGMACRFPGAGTPQEFWRNLVQGRVSIGEVPAERWRWQDHAGEIGEDTVSARRWGGFLDEYDVFDRAFFGMSVRETAPMDPQQRIGLELAWSCFENAGLRPSAFAGERVGVFVGIANLDYKEIVEEADLVDAHYATGIGASVLANRLSYWFDFRGPSVSIDTACSSSLFAIHAASRALRDDECGLALAGGVSLLLTPRRFTCFAKARMLSPTGMIRSFDDAADGMVRGEGGGLILLEPLDRALANGHNILGIIKGSAVNHGGRTRSLTYPSPAAQADVIARAQKAAGVAPANVSYIEAHGTGTPKGDPIEVQGLLKAFGAGADCGIGSVKPNVGHLEAAAGIAGVIKVLLAMEHETLPPLANFRTLNSRMSLDGTGFRIVDRAEPWQAPGTRIAGVSSFGFAGTNAHVIVEEAPAAADRSQASIDEHIFVLSAKTAEALERKRAGMLRWLDGEGRRFELSDICAALIHGREHFEVRLAVVGRTREEILDRLSRGEYRQDIDPATCGLYEPSFRAAASMPTYPFEKTRCWVTATKADTIGKPTAIALRPLADETPTEQPVPPPAEPSIDDLLEQIYLGNVDIDSVIDEVDEQLPTA